jgi:molybdopterin-guanine dinucleotide biosynthesis protein
MNIPVITIIAKSGSGKITLLEKIIPEGIESFQMGAIIPVQKLIP